MAKIDKLLEQAQPHLYPGERVLAVIQGTYETKILGSDSVRNGILISSERRIVFYAKKLGGYDLESFDYSNVSSFEQSKNMMGHSISFYASGNKVSMKWINDLAAMAVFVDAVRPRLGGGLAPQGGGGPAPWTMPQQPAPVPPMPQHAAPAPPMPQPPASIPPIPQQFQPSPGAVSGHDAVIDAIKKLGDLHSAGILTDAEFGSKKAELLARL